MLIARDRTNLFRNTYILFQNFIPPDKPIITPLQPDPTDPMMIYFSMFCESIDELSPTTAHSSCSLVYRGSIIHYSLFYEKIIIGKCANR